MSRENIGKKILFDRFSHLLYNDKVMYAIIDSGNKQFKVSKGDVIEIELLPETEKVLFDKVLLVADGDNVSVGTPYLTKAKVAGS